MAAPGTNLPWEAVRSKVCLLQLSWLDADIASTAARDPKRNKRAPLVCPDEIIL